MFEYLRFLPFLERYQGDDLILATIVATKGSSYRKTGTQMLIAKDFSHVGQLSGGCVEKEVFRQCVSVFSEHKSKVFEYDGTYRLGCKGVITVLLEPLSSDFQQNWRNMLAGSSEQRQGMILQISQEKGSYATGYQAIGLTVEASQLSNPESVREIYVPSQRRLLVIGAEYDAGILCEMATATGFDVIRAVHQQFVSKGDEPYQLFSGEPCDPEILQLIDNRTGIVLMTHSWAKDLIWLSELIKKEVVYLGVLGPKQRKADLIDALIEKYDITDPELVDKIRGPIGIAIPTRTAEEISVSVVAELIQAFAESEAA